MSKSELIVRFDGERIAKVLFELAKEDGLVTDAYEKHGKFVATEPNPKFPEISDLVLVLREPKR